jgi:RNA polymerase sigma factor (sigma-70 family)
MASGQLSSVVRYIRKLAGVPASGNLTDGQLLERFTFGQDEAAFETLLERHGPMVLGICRRLLPDPHDAEDAFQATFLVLLCKAGSIAKRESAGSWLHGVAHRIAVRAKTRAERQRARAMPLPELPDENHADIPTEAYRRELCAALAEELDRLPEKHRAPLVLCYLEGKSRHEAAQQLRWPEGTVQRRLARGRELLHSKLVRRGLTLSAVLSAAGLSSSAAPAAVPAALTAATLKAAVFMAAGKGSAAGAVSAQAAALTKAALNALFLAKLKVATALVLAVGAFGVGAGTLTQHVLAQRQSDATENQTRPQQTSAASGPTVATKTPMPDETKASTISGQVLDPEGKSVAGAQVGVLSYPEQSLGEEPTGKPFGFQVGKANETGHFQLRVPKSSPKPFVPRLAFAAAPGFGFGWRHLSPETNQPAVLIRLHPERIIRGRVLDVQGQPVAGAKVQATRAVFTPEGDFFFNPWADQGADWPEPVRTDAQGRFVVRGVGRDVQIDLDIQSERFARRRIEIVPETKADDKELAVVLTPEARSLSGRVIYRDTRRPVPNARLHVTAYSERFQGSAQQMNVRADDKGHFQLKPYAGKFFLIEAYAPKGEAYLGFEKSFDWPKGTVQQEIEVALPRGVLVRGKVTEESSGKPIAGATVDFFPQRVDAGPDSALSGWRSAVVSKSDGSFQIGVLPGLSYLLIQGPTLDYIHHELFEKSPYRGVISDKPEGPRLYPDGWVKLDLKAGDEPEQVKITLRRGVTVEGRLVGPDGKPVAKAAMLCRLHVTAGYGHQWQHNPVDVYGGRFQLRGCDPEKSYPVLFLDSDHHWGAAVEISGKQAGGEPVTVRLAPCGTAKARLLNSQGKPAKNFPPMPNLVWLEVVVTPGRSLASRFREKEATDKDTPYADELSLCFVDRKHYWDLRSDTEGRCTFPALIPGATYRIIGQGLSGGTIFQKDFTVESGQMLDLGDVTITR